VALRTRRRRSPISAPSGVGVSGMRCWAHRTHLLAAVVLGACGRAADRHAAPPTGALTVRDDAERVVMLPGPARRIVSLTPSSTELLFALGAGPFLAAHYRDSLFDALTLSAGGPASLAGLLSLLVMVALAGSAWALAQVVRLSPLEAMRHE